MNSDVANGVRPKTGRRLGIAASALIAVANVGFLLAVVGDWRYRAVIAATERGTRPGDFGAVVDGWSNSQPLYLLIFLAGVLIAGIVFVAWLRRARVTSELLCAARHRLPRGWVVGAWITPVVWLWFPAWIVSDVYRASHPRTPRHAQSLARSGVAIPVVCWWTTWSAAWLVFWISWRFVTTDPTTGSPVKTLQQMTIYSILCTVAAALFCCSAVLAIAIITRVDRWQRMERAIEPVLVPVTSCPPAAGFTAPAASVSTPQPKSGLWPILAVAAVVAGVFVAAVTVAVGVSPFGHDAARAPLADLTFDPARARAVEACVVLERAAHAAHYEVASSAGRMRWECVIEATGVDTGPVGTVGISFAANGVGDTTGRTLGGHALLRYAHGDDCTEQIPTSAQPATGIQINVVARPAVEPRPPTFACDMAEALLTESIRALESPDLPTIERASVIGLDPCDAETDALVATMGPVRRSPKILNICDIDGADAFLIVTISYGPESWAPVSRPPRATTIDIGGGRTAQQLVDEDCSVSYQQRLNKRDESITVVSHAPAGSGEAACPNARAAIISLVAKLTG
ncbi:DUF4328 domain-containing protein [Nocardia thailandica]